MRVNYAKTTKQGAKSKEWLIELNEELKPVWFNKHNETYIYKPMNFLRALLRTL